MWQFATIFAAVFLAELGDKTQLATLLFSVDGKTHPLAVFAAAASALCVSSGLVVAIGVAGARQLDSIPLKLIAGIGFVAIGAWSIIDHFRTS
jgi:putative Ca2+/H+ antiporter (TMEM165/GDT1 family)